MIRRAPVTMMLLVVIAIVFAFELMADPSFSEETLIRLGAIMPWPMHGEYWRLVAAMFLHAGWLHWAVNSWALYQLGMLYESLFGSPRFALIYFASGLCASSASSLAGHGPAVGASGAIFGILGAFIFSIRRSPQYRHQPWTRGLIGQLIFWILVNIGIGLSSNSARHSASRSGAS